MNVLKWNILRATFIVTSRLPRSVFLAGRKEIDPNPMSEIQSDATDEDDLPPRSSSGTARLTLDSDTQPDFVRGIICGDGRAVLRLVLRSEKHACLA